MPAPPDPLIAKISEFDRLPLPGGILDVSGTIIAINQIGCRLLARPAVELVGHKAWDFAPGIEHVWSELVRFARERGHHVGELAIATPIGARTIRYVLAVREAAGQAYVLAFGIDVLSLE